jgi:trimethylamine:corrinoid methyltransferase-like protein
MAQAKAKQVAVVRTKLTFGDEDVRAIHSAAHRVWEEVGYDVLTDGMGEDAYAEANGGRSGRTIPRSHVIEIVADAGRLEEQLEQDGHKDLAARYAALDYEAIKKLLRPAFPYARYGM